jgi:Cupin
VTYKNQSFFLAGRHLSGQQTYESETGSQQTYRMGQFRGNNIFNGFDSQMLAEALGVNIELARRLQSQTDQRGEIVSVRQGLQLLRPSRSQEMQQQQFEESVHGQQHGEHMQGQYNVTNGLDETFCTMKIRTNIDEPSRADYYNQRVGRVTRVDSQKLPILNIVQMSATRVVLQRVRTLQFTYIYMLHVLRSEDIRLVGN